MIIFFSPKTCQETDIYIIFLLEAFQEPDSEQFHVANNLEAKQILVLQVPVYIKCKTM